MSKIKMNYKTIESILSREYIPIYWDKNGDLIEEKGAKFYGCLFMSEEDDGRDLGYFLDPKKNAVVVDCNEFTTKECMTIINIVNAQLETDYDYSIAFGNVEAKDFVRYCEKCAENGTWCCGFIEKFNEVKDEINRITIKPMWIDEIEKAIIIIMFE